MIEPGALLAGRYRLGEMIGRGGTAVVYRASDIRLDRDVAVKILAPELAADPTVGERFLREARTMAALNHPAIVQIFDVEWFGEAGQHPPFLVMELVAGGTLADRLAVDGRLPPDELAAVVEPIAAALATMHAAGLVHRDVKPQNILLGPSGPKLADLGVVRFTDGAALTAELTAPNATLGTLRYLAPEVLDGQPAGPPADAFALGMVGFLALTGRSPRPAVTLGDLVAVADRPAPLASAVAPELGTAFDAPLRAALELDPRQRSDVATLASGLRAAVSEAPPSTSTPAPALPPSPAPVPGVPMPASADADTAALELPTIVVPPPRPVPPQTRARAAQRSILAVLALVALAAAIVVVAAALAGPDRFGGLPTASAPAAEPTPAPSASPTVAPTESPTSSPTPSATTDPVEAAIIALRAAIDGARGGSDGLNGNEANELLSDVFEIERAVDGGRLDEAAEKAGKLLERVEKLADGDLSAVDAARLLGAAVGLTLALANR